MSKWTVIRSTERLDYFEGVEGATAQDALEAYFDGAGTLNQLRSGEQPWELRAVREDES